MIKTQKGLLIVNLLCIAQFLFLLFYTKANPHLNGKFIVLLSVIFALVVSGLARRLFVEHNVEESTKPLDVGSFDSKKDDSTKDNGK